MVFLKRFQKPDYKFTFYLLAAWLPLVIFSLLGTDKKHQFLMAVSFLFLFLPLVNIKAFQKLFLSVSLGKRAFMLTIVGLLCYAQILQQWSLSYPFVNFTMFTQPVSTKVVRYYEYEGLIAGGSAIPLNPTAVIPSLRQRRIQQRLTFLADTVTKAAVSPNAASYTQKLRATLGAIGNLYNKKNPLHPILMIRMYKRQFNMDQYKNDSSITKAMILEINVEKQP